MPADKIGIDKLRELLTYEPETGDIRWRVKKGTKGRPGKLAGSTHKDHDTYYLRVMIDYKGYCGHHIAFALYYGRWPDRVDHEDHNGLNNRISNLREATASQNQHNRGAQRNNKLGVKGVHVQRGAYVAQIYLYNKHIYLGRYKTIEAASRAYQEAAIKLHGEFARVA